MNSYTQLDIPGYEEVVRCDNPEIGFIAWIAIHFAGKPYVSLLGSHSHRRLRDKTV